MAEFVDRRRRELEGFGHEAEAAARDAYGKAIRSGEDLALKTQGQVMRYGADLVGGKRAVTGAGVPRPAISSNDGNEGATWLDRNPTAKALGAVAAQRVGRPLGVVRGGLHAVEGLADTAVFAAGLANPYDSTSRDQAANFGRTVVGKLKDRIEDPQLILQDVQSKAHKMRVDLDPSATPVAPTFAGELRRNFDIGMNQGELTFNVGSLAVGGPLAKGATRLGALSKAASYERALARGRSPALAEYLSEPYVGRGHHSVFPQRAKLPAFLGGGPVPRSILESPFSRLTGEGMTREDFYDLHFRTDPKFTTARLPDGFVGESWRGESLGLKKNGLPGRVWEGTPPALKARIGGLTASLGSALYSKPDEGR